MADRQEPPSGADASTGAERAPTPTVRSGPSSSERHVESPAVSPNSPGGIPIAPLGASVGAFAGLLAEAHGPPLPVGQIPFRKPGHESKSSDSGNNGERRIGPYRVLEELGCGGMAVVYKAEQPALDRIVAIKELRPEYVSDRQIAARFEREATSLAALQHGNIIHIYDFIRDHESAFIVMEFLEGIDLFDLLDKTTRVPPEVAGIIALQVAEGLEYAHYRGIIHRDIKPSNILISKTGEVKVMDFGIARDPGKSDLTQVGVAVGTPAYMAPEQIRGDTVDFRTDIFALGIVLYEMLSGKKPWPEDSQRAVTVKVLDDDYPPISNFVPDIPHELVRVLSRCLNKNPAERYASTYALRRDLTVYVNRFVPFNPRGRVVLFLRNREQITESEASNFVEAGLLKDSVAKRRDQGFPVPPAKDLFRPVGLAYGIALVLILLAGVFSAFSPFGRRLTERPRQAVMERRRPTPPAMGSPEVASAEVGSTATAPTAVAASDTAQAGAGASGAAGTAQPGADEEHPPPRGNEGFLRVLVDPWARVFVDGEFYDFTPFAGHISLVPGRHRIALRNPYFQPIDHFVEIESGQEQVLRASLVPREETREETRDGARNGPR